MWSLSGLVCLLIGGVNLNGDNIYDISNRNFNSKIQFPTNYLNISSNYKYFDVYSLPITSKYAEVYWTMMGDVLLPENIIKEYQNKTMAIVGYEMDQVFKTPDGDVSVPITWAYNHHYIAYLLGGESKIIDFGLLNKKDYGSFNHGAKKTWTLIEGQQIDNIPNSQMFSEGNGGESRGSFHGYPRNNAQLIRSPRVFKLQPMQIDTRNRDIRYINSSVFHPGIMPNRSAAPINASYSGLLECPCTTRINKTIIYKYDIQTNNICDKCITDPEICYNESLKLNNVFTNNSYFKIINSSSFPHGCFYIKNSDSLDIFYNTKNSNVSCGLNFYQKEGNSYFNQENINLSITIDLQNNISEQLEITLIGPNDYWFGLGFNASLMADLPYTIIVDGYGNIYEYKLGNHILGTMLKPSLKLKHTSTNNNLRTVVLTRPLNLNDVNYFNFDNQSSIPIIGALGNTKNISYHKFRSGQNLYISQLNSTTCVCDSEIVEGFINGVPFSKICAPEPKADLLRQKNPSCFIDTYQGGLACCHHKNILLDSEQIQPEHEMTYHLKFRFWYEDYVNHKSLIRLYYQTEAYSGEYDIPKCLDHEECVHVITARWQAKDMIFGDIKFNKNDILRLAHVGPHCHAPTCISMELFNDDTGESLCKVDGTFGSGNLSKRFDEKDYIKINPCLFGFDSGLFTPPKLFWNTNLSSIKRANNTYAHYGDMASWQMRGYFE